MKNSPVAVFARLSARHAFPSSHDRAGTAVVLGGSIAGLLAARVLSDHTETVIILERNTPPPANGSAQDCGSYAPQATQVHTLLPGGRLQIERWFPNFTKQAQAGGAVLSDPALVGEYFDGVKGPTPNTPGLLTSSRPFLEDLLRRRTLALPNVKLVAARATGLEFADDAVSGVQYTTDAGDTGVQLAEFVVDAMGRASKLGDWLTASGWSPPPMQRVAASVNYATARFRRCTKDREVAAAIARFSPPVVFDGGLAVAAASPIEDSQWMIMLAGYGETRPGRTRSDFLARCAHLPPPFPEAAGGEQITDIKTYRLADSRRRDYHLLPRLPARLVSLGDAVASFNPVYGQGMSSAALHASCLAEYLQATPDLAVPARDFFALQRVVVDAAWELSASGDAPYTPDPRRAAPTQRLKQWMQMQVVMAAGTDPVIGNALREAAFMLTHPATLGAPQVALRALMINFRNRRTAQ